mgnify:CR=1 FL=1
MSTVQQATVPFTTQCAQVITCQQLQVAMAQATNQLLVSMVYLTQTLSTQAKHLELNSKHFNTPSAIAGGVFCVFIVKMIDCNIVNHYRSELDGKILQFIFRRNKI